MVSRGLALLACSIALLAGLGAGTVAADPGVAITAPPTNETLGDVVELTVSVPENGTATVVVQQADGGYSRDVTLTDSSGDGTVTVAINTFTGSRADISGPVYSAGESDTATVTDNASGLLRAGTYEVAVYPSADTNGTTAETRRVTLSEPTRGEMRVDAVRGSQADRVTSVAAVQRGRRDGWVDNRSTVPLGARAVIELHVDGIEGAVAATPGDNDTERFTAMLDRTNTTFEAINYNTGPEVPPVILRLDTSQGTVYQIDPDNDTYVALVDPGRAPYGFRHETAWDPGDPDDGDDLVPQFVVDGTRRLNPDPYDEPNRGVFTVVERDPTLYTNGESVGVTPGSTLTVGGRTELLPGTELRVRLVSETESDRYRTATVDESGQFTVTFGVNTSEVGPYTSVTVGEGDTPHSDAPVKVVERRPVRGLPSELTASTDAVTATVGPLEDGGTLHVVGPNGTVLARSDGIQPGRIRNVTVALPTAELSAGDTLTVFATEARDGTEPYVVDGPPIGQTIEVTAGEQSPVSDANTPDGTATPTEQPSPSATAPATTTTAADGPGFGVVATLVAGLLSLATGLARRR